MSSFDPHPTTWPLRIFLLGSAVTAIAAVTVAVTRVPARPAPAAPLVAVAPLVEPAEPIVTEALVFRTGSAMLAIEPEARRQRSAHTRTLKTFRFLRAYPGAPPRIPHPLSPDEFRAGACKSCHERGGYSLRFAAYVPVTPHPEMGMCLQCHAGDDALMGVALPSADPSTRCAQCHGPDGGPLRPEASLTWWTTVWPKLSPRTPGQLPPPIPHDLQLRGNCLACHSGPAAVAEIRSTHPERANCRQCHLAIDSKAEPFTGPPHALAVGAGGTP